VLTRHHEYQRIFLKEKRTCEPNSFLSQAARWNVCERPPYSLCSLDHPTRFLFAKWHTCRSGQKQSGASGGKCAFTTKTDRTQAAGETPSIHEEGSHTSRARSLGCSGVEANALDRPAGNPATASIVSSSACTGSAGQRSQHTSPMIANLGLASPGWRQQVPLRFSKHRIMRNARMPSANAFEECEARMP
jgi:hypothetical protein